MSTSFQPQGSFRRMNQIYIQPGVSFPFSCHFQRRLSEEITALVVPSAAFIKKYGADFNLIFRVSAKKDIQDNEIRGPTLFKKDKDVEYTVFLPFDVITCHPEVSKSALVFLLQGVCSVFELLEIETTSLAEIKASLVEKICSDPTMLKQPPMDYPQLLESYRDKATTAESQLAFYVQARTEGVAKLVSFALLQDIFGLELSQCYAIDSQANIRRLDA